MPPITRLLGDLFTPLRLLPGGQAYIVPVASACLIVAVVLLAGFCQLSLLGRYRRVRSFLGQVRDRLTGTISFDNVRGAMHEVADVSDRGAGAFLHDYLDRAARRGDTFQPSEAVDAAADRERQLWRAAFVRWVTGAALVMGLAGTFIAFMQLVTGSGLLEALGTLRDTPPSTGASPALVNSYAQLSVAFTRVYQGFGYAFAASLTGLLGTLGLGFINNLLVARSLQACLTQVEDFSDEVLRPLLAPPRHTDDFSDALKTAATVLGSSGEAMLSLKETSSVLDRAARRFEKSQGANSEMVATLTKLATELESSRKGWDILLDALRESRASMGHTVEEFKREAAAQRELTNASATEIVTAMRSNADGMAAEIKKIAAAKAEHFQSVQDDVRRMVTESKKDWDAVSDALLVKTSEAFKGALSTVQGVIQEGRQDAAVTQREIAGLTRETAAAVTAHQQTLATHAQAVTAALQQWSEAPAALAAVVQSGHGALERLNDTLAAVAAMPAAWEGRVLGTIRQLDTKLDESGARMDRLAANGQGWRERWTRFLRWRNGG